jgi:uncharacterized RDD family membrane protein YckC
MVRFDESIQIHVHTLFAAARPRWGRPDTLTCHEEQRDMSSSTVGVGDDDLVTGEAVALELPAAGIALHALSGFLDVTLAILALMIGVFVIPLVTAGADDAIAGTVTTVFMVLVFVVLPTTLETLTRGRSVGKLATGLRTVRDDAGPIGFRHALTRALVGFVEIWLLFCVPALVSGLVSPKGKRLGDHAAGTYVVRERVHLTLPPPPMMPRELAAWAAGADIARLPDGLAMAVRQFVMRAPLLSPNSRAAIGVQLYDEVVAYLAPAPPLGIHPELVLAAVIADRRRRDGVRLSRDAALRRRLIPTDPIDSPTR